MLQVLLLLRMLMLMMLLLIMLVMLLVMLLQVVGLAMLFDYRRPRGLEVRPFELVLLVVVGGVGRSEDELAGDGSCSRSRRSCRESLQVGIWLVFVLNVTLSYRRARLLQSVALNHNVFKLWLGCLV